MEAEESFLWEEFCENMIDKATEYCEKQLQLYLNELPLYIGKERIDYIHTKRALIIDYLKSSNFYKILTLDIIENDLNKGLARFFRMYGFMEVKQVRYESSLSFYHYKLDVESGILTVNEEALLHCHNATVNFSILDDLSPIAEHIGHGMLLLELNKMETELIRLKKAAKIKATIEALYPEGIPIIETINCPKDVKVNQLALICAYEGIHITMENASAYAAEHGYTHPTSGHGLYQDYNKYIKKDYRTAEPTNRTKVTLGNKIELFESILSYLSENPQKQALADIASLQKLYTQYYA